MPLVFKISSDPLDLVAVKATLVDHRAGACVTFEGWVRDLNEGRPVRALEYEAYAILAEKEGARILSEANERFQIISASCVHRIGLLQLGDMAVWVGVTAAHRDAAFAACRYIIDEAKARIPIWKKEHYTDGATAWINCASRGDFAQTESPH